MDDVIRSATITELRILFYAIERGAITPEDVANFLVVSKDRAYTLLWRMVRKGLLERVQQGWYRVSPHMVSILCEICERLACSCMEKSGD